MPMIAPTSVMSEPDARAMPKSATLMWSSASTITFAGFRSRWITPRLCAKRVAARISFTIPIVRAGSIGASRRMTSLSVSPSTNSIAM